MRKYTRKVKDPYDKKLRIYPTYKQRLIIDSMINSANEYHNALLTYWNYYFGLYKEQKDTFRYEYRFSDYVTEFGIRDKIQEKVKILYPYLFDENDNRYLYRDSRDIIDEQLKDAFSRMIHFNLGKPRLKKNTSNFYKSIAFKSGDKNAVRFDKNDNREGSHRRINIPCFRSMKVAHTDFISKDELRDTYTVIIKREPANKYYAIFKTKGNRFHQLKHLDDGIGIDLGDKRYATIYGKITTYVPNPLKTKEVEYCFKQIDKLQRIANRKRDWYAYKGIPEQAKYSRKINHLDDRVNRYYYRIKCIIRDFIDKLCDLVTKLLRPKFITIEGLKIGKMIRFKTEREFRLKRRMNNWYRFRRRLTDKCREYGIELRIASIEDLKSSKTCSCCGKVREKFSSQEYFICKNEECKMYNVKIDRDMNAAKNLYQTSNYVVIK